MYTRQSILKKLLHRFDKYIFILFFLSLLLATLRWLSMYNAEQTMQFGNKKKYLDEIGKHVLLTYVRPD